MVPQAAAHLPILGVLGDAGVLTKTELLVVTATHAFVGWENARASFAWAEVTDVGAPEDDLDVCMLRTERLGWIGVPARRKSKAFAEVLQRIVARLAAAQPVDPDA